MKTIKKRGEDLRRGDVITKFLGVADLSAPAVVLFDYSAGRATMMDAEGTIRTPMIGYDSTVLVQAPVLTPAQEHAEELLRYFRHYLALCQFVFERLPDEHNRTVLGKRISELSALLAKIDPPKAPTYEEALAALDGIIKWSLADVSDKAAYEVCKKARDVLDRARRANVMP